MKRNSNILLTPKEGFHDVITTLPSNLAICAASEYSAVWSAAVAEQSSSRELLEAGLHLMSGIFSKSNVNITEIDGNR